MLSSLAAGAWTGKLMARFHTLAVPQRQVVGWFKTPDESYRPESFPVFILDCPERGNFYGFPEVASEGFKIGKFRHRKENVDPDTIERRRSHPRMPRC